MSSGGKKAAAEKTKSHALPMLQTGASCTPPDQTIKGNLPPHRLEHSTAILWMLKGADAMNRSCAFTRFVKLLSFFSTKSTQKKNMGRRNNTTTLVLAAVAVLGLFVVLRKTGGGGGAEPAAAQWQGEQQASMEGDGGARGVRSDTGAAIESAADAAANRAAAARKKAQEKAAHDAMIAEKEAALAHILQHAEEAKAEAAKKAADEKAHASMLSTKIHPMYAFNIFLHHLPAVYHPPPPPPPHPLCLPTLADAAVSDSVTPGR